MSQNESAEHLPLPTLSLDASKLIEIAASGISSARLHPEENSSIPFSDLLQPWVDFAMKSCCSDSIDCAQQLLRELSSIAALPLLWWFTLYGPEREEFSASGSGKYAAFVGWMQSQGWREIFTEYPDLADLLASTLNGSMSSTREFLARFDADVQPLTAWLGDETSRLDVTGCIPGFSDHHNQHRSVIAVDLKSGERLAYKPRPLSAEVAFQKLCRWVAQRDAGLDLFPAHVLPRDDHGWMRWIDPAPCEDASAYYERAGMLQCVLQMLGSSDAHMGNCVAAGNGPALIDCECLLTPRSRAEDKSDSSMQVVFEEMRATGLMPRDRRPRDEPDLSGLTGHGGQPCGYSVPKWSAPNSDAMQLAFRPARLRVQQNQPPALSRITSGEAIIRGYSGMYLFLCDHREDLLADPEVMEGLKHARIRVLVRDTRKYTHILSRSIHPRHLRDSSGRNRAIRTWLLQDALGLSPAAEVAIVDAETSALARLDVPLFHSTGVAHHLFCDGAMVLPDFFRESGFERFTARLAAANAVALNEHQHALRLLWIMSQ